MSPVLSRYIRAIYLLPGVKGGSEAKRAKGASQAAEKEDNCCRSCGTVSLFYCCKLGLVGLRAVWYCFLVVSGKSSTVLAVLYCFLTWYTSLETLKQKTETERTSPILASSFITRAWSRFKLLE